jgi:4-hydroxybenzoate polyprenyltransferase
MKRIILFLSLIRIQNLVIAAATQVLMQYCIIQPILHVRGLELKLPLADFITLLFCTAMIGAAGYIINDYYNVQEDLINKPDKVIISKNISKKTAMLVYTILNILGIGLGMYISYRAGSVFYSVFFLLVAGMLWFYSTSYKSIILVGNLVVSLIVAFIPIIVLVFNYPYLVDYYREIILLNPELIRRTAHYIFAFAFFAFLTNLIREIVKDTEDFEGDKAYGINSLPVVFGITVSKIISIFFILTELIVISLVFYKHLLFSFYEKIDFIGLIYLILCIISPLIASVILIISANRQKNYTITSLLIKITFITGLGYCFIMRYNILNLLYK